MSPCPEISTPTRLSLGHGKVPSVYSLPGWKVVSPRSFRDSGLSLNVVLPAAAEARAWTLTVPVPVRLKLEVSSESAVGRRKMREHNLSSSASGMSKLKIEDTVLDTSPK